MFHKFYIIFFLNSQHTVQILIESISTYQLFDKNVSSAVVKHCSKVPQYLSKLFNIVLGK